MKFIRQMNNGHKAHIEHTNHVASDHIIGMCDANEIHSSYQGERERVREKRRRN